MTGRPADGHARDGAGAPRGGAPARHGTPELRVLSGLHAQASCPAEDGAVLGSDPDCDVVLADLGMPARAARLRLDAQGWMLQAEGGTAGGPAGWNQPLPLGPVWLTVAPPSAAWIAAPAARPGSGTAAAGDPAAGEPGAGDPAPGALPDSAGHAAAGGGASAPGTAGPAQAPAAGPGTPAGPRPQALRPAWPLFLGLGTALLAVAVAIVLALLPPASPPAPTALDSGEAARQSLGRVTEALERLGLGARLQAGLTAAGTVRVTGWVRNAAERDAVAAALSQLWPMPAMRISVEDEVVQTASQVLRAFGIRYEARYEGQGRLMLHGIAASARERAAALDAVRAQLPGMTVIGQHIALAPEVADALSSALAQAGLSGIELAWAADRLEVRAGHLEAGQSARLDEILARFNATHLQVAQRAAPGERPMADSVPFGIRSVVGGPQPFIVLEDGSKLLVGGVHGQYRLSAIEPTRLIFEGPQPAIVLR
ncbi:type III secretion system inner membrane ring subunit SctD [Orrella sp. JC864]|uniref:type III secretion system inner membrane ring subunit SctD n=1 Tax=Orrella sp. JC864 TaxID=3120298 RepID=UPI00300B4101